MLGTTRLAGQSTKSQPDRNEIDRIAESARPELDRRWPIGRRYVRSPPSLGFARYKVTEQILPVREQLRIAEGLTRTPAQS